MKKARKANYQGVKKCFIFDVLQQPNFVKMSSKSTKTKLIASLTLKDVLQK